MKDFILRTLAKILNKYCGHEDGFFNMTHKDDIFHVKYLCKRCGICHEGDIRFVDDPNHPLI